MSAPETGSRPPAAGAIFTLPDLGEGLQDAEIVAWHVAPGDHVVADQPLVSVETEKAVVEVPSPRAGRIARLFAEVGTRVPVGAALVAFAEGAVADQGGIVGSLPDATGMAPAPRPAVPRAMPAARAKAQALGLDLATISGSGPDGTITLSDVEAAATANATPLRGVRLAMAQNMARARDSIAPATLHDDADVEAWGAETDHTIRLVRALVAGCHAAPALNAWLDPGGQARTLHARIDVGVAVATEDGLFVPVLRDVAGRPASVLRSEFDAMKAAIASRSIAPQALRGPTITLSNFGVLGGRYATLVIVPPQVAILGAGRIARRPVLHDGAVAVRRLLPLSLTFDHRAVTGAEAARFMAAVIADLGLPD